MSTDKFCAYVLYCSVREARQFPNNMILKSTIARLLFGFPSQMGLINLSVQSKPINYSLINEQDDPQKSVKSAQIQKHSILLLLVVISPRRHRAFICSYAFCWHDNGKKEMSRAATFLLYPPIRRRYGQTIPRLQFEGTFRIKRILFNCGLLSFDKFLFTF